MVDDLLQPLSAIELLCDELLSQEYGLLAQRQIEKVKIIQSQAKNLTMFCEDYLSQSVSIEAGDRHKLWNLCSEFRTPCAVIDASVHLMRVYNERQIALLTTQQQNCQQDMLDQVRILKAVWNQIMIDLLSYSVNDASG